jgi:hypothetical protein
MTVSTASVGMRVQQMMDTRDLLKGTILTIMSINQPRKGDALFEAFETGKNIWHDFIYYKPYEEPTCKKEISQSKNDPVKAPKHYIDVIPGIECIDITKHFNYCKGNVIKYIWRSASKGNEIQDLEKARQYIDFEIARLKNESK